MLAQPPTRPPDEPAWDQKEMPFTEHLRELRTRLLISIATVAGLSVVLFLPAPYLIRAMVAAYFHGIQLHAFGPADVILVEVKLSIVGGIVLGLPVLLYQLWMFVVPVFHPRTRRMVYVYVLPSLILAFAGLAFAHFLVIPRVIHALVAITQGVAIPTFGVGDTLNFVLIFFAIFAIIFQLPIVMIALARIGVVNAAMLMKYRKHCLVGFVVAGGAVAPDGNPLTMLMLAAPMYVLFEASIWVIVLLEKSWKRADAAA
jgi:sec-independent protein translocase protein TatC